ncbi:MAG: hypothetical protein JOS17DRAFT_61156 [Linnemannia elongata]|nr:MAG: hypothetical protein JOS17DRAFT_61156 [Linnemannia elongata]
MRFFSAPLLIGLGEREESARYQQDAETFSWASDELLSSEEEEKQENEAPSEDNAETTYTNISAETAAAIASLNAADIEIYKQLIESVELAGYDPIYSYHYHHNDDNIRREESTDESQVASGTIAKSGTVRSESSSAIVSSEVHENVFPLFGPQDIASPSTRPPRLSRPIPQPPPPPRVPFDFEMRLNLPHRRQRSGFYNDTFYRPISRKYVPPFIRENYTPVVRIQDTPDIIPEFMGIDIPTGKAGCARRDALVKRPSALKKRVDNPIGTHVSINVEEAPTTICPHSEPEASAAPATSTKAEPEPDTATLNETK